MKMTYDKTKKTFTLKLTRDEHLVFGHSTFHPPGFVAQFDEFRLVPEREGFGAHLLPVSEVPADMRYLRDALMNVATETLAHYLSDRDLVLDREDMSWPSYCEANWPGFAVDLPDHRMKNRYGEKPKRIAA